MQGKVLEKWQRKLDRGSRDRFNHFQQNWKEKNLRRVLIVVMIDAEPLQLS